MFDRNTKSQLYKNKKSKLNGFTTVFNENKILVMGGHSSIGETDVVRKFDILHKNYDSVDETKLKLLKKELDHLFAVIMHVDKQFLGKQY